MNKINESLRSEGVRLYEEACRSENAAQKRQALKLIAESDPNFNLGAAPAPSDESGGVVPGSDSPADHPRVSIIRVGEDPFGRREPTVYYRTPLCGEEILYCWVQWWSERDAPLPADWREQYEREIDEQRKKSGLDDGVRANAADVETGAAAAFAQIERNEEFTFLGERFKKSSEREAELKRDGTVWDFADDERVERRVAEVD